MSNALSRRGLLFTLAAAVLVTGAAPVCAEGGGGGGDGRRVASKPTSGRGKKKTSKFKAHAEVLKENYRTKGMGYYFLRESRMKRLLERLYQEKKAGDVHMFRTLMNIRDRLIGRNLNAKKHKPQLAKNIIDASFVYEAYKDKKIKHAEYKATMHTLIGFAP